MTKYINIYSKSVQYPLNTLIFLTKYSKHTFTLQLQGLLPKKTEKYGPQMEFTIEHRMFSLKVYPSPENFTQPLVAMVMTFCMSGRGRVCYQRGHSV